MSQELADFSSTHFRGVSLAVKKDVFFNPVDVGLFGAVTIVTGTNKILYAFEQSWHGEAPFVRSANLLDRQETVQNRVATATTAIY